MSLEPKYMSGYNLIIMNHYRKNPMIVARMVDGQGYLVPLADDIQDMKKMYRLNPLGWFIWQVLDPVTDLDALSERIAGEFDVEKITAFKDAEDFLKHLSNIGSILEEEPVDGTSR